MKAIEPEEGPVAVAWRCESDRKLHPVAEPSFVVYIEELGMSVTNRVSLIASRRYFIRRMIVCRACRRVIANLEPPMPDQPASAGTRTPEATNTGSNP